MISKVSFGSDTSSQIQEPKTELEALNRILEQQRVQSSLLRKIDKNMDTFTKKSDSKEPTKDTSSMENSMDNMSNTITKMNDNMKALKSSITCYIPGLTTAIQNMPKNY